MKKRLQSAQMEPSDAVPSSLAHPSVADGHVQAAGQHGVRVDCIDVGKGDCILVQSGASFALIDTGYEKTSDVVLSHLRKRGVNRLDALVITHYDKDHVGGLRAVAQALDVHSVYLPGYVGGDKVYEEAAKTVSELRLPAREVAEVLHLKLDEARVSIYPPGVAYKRGSKGDEGNDNDASMVVSLAYREDSYLFAADLEEDGIKAYLHGRHGRFDVIKMPHHGARYPNTGDLLEEVRPEIALITDSDDEPADKKTLKLLAKCGVDTYRTSNVGTIVVESDGTGRYTVKNRPLGARFQISARLDKGGADGQTICPRCYSLNSAAWKDRLPLAIWVDGFVSNDVPCGGTG